MNWKSVTRICFGVSCAVNIGAVSVIGARAKLANDARVAAATENHPSRLIEIRKLAKTPDHPEATTKRAGGPLASSPKTSGSQAKSGTSNGSVAPGHEGNGAAGSSQSIDGEIKLAQGAGGSTASSGGAKHIPIHATVHANGVVAMNLAPPKPQVSAGYDGVLDLKNSKVDIQLKADPALLPKGKQKPTTIIGHSTVEWIGGKPIITAKCVGVVGGGTIYASHLKIKGAKNVTISGTKFCGPGGGPPIPLGASRGQGTGSSASTGGSKGAGLAGSGSAAYAFHASGDQATLARNYSDLASGPHNSEDYLKVNQGTEPGVQGEFRPVHLPDVERPRTLNDHEQKKELTAEDKRAEKGLQPKIGSFSANGSLPWGPSKSKPKHGLLADFYTGREFQKFQFTRRTAFVNYNWDNVRPDVRLPEFQPYSVRWTGYIKPTTSETYTIYTASDDGVRLWIDDRLVIDNWTCHAESEDVVQVSLNSGTFHRIRLDYFEASGLRGQRIRLYWQSPTVAKEYVPETCLYYTKD